MTQIIIDDGSGTKHVLSDPVVAALAPHVARTNDANGSRYSTAEWIMLHIQEIAIADDLAATIIKLQEQQQRDAQSKLETDIKTARELLLTNIGVTI